MTARPVTTPVLLRYAQEALKDDYRLLVLHATPTWDGEDTLEADGTPVRVVPVDSPLAARAALVDHQGGDGEVLVLLTDRSDLGQELLARAWRNEPVRPTSAEACKRLFQAEALHRRLGDHRWLLDLLVDVAPHRGYPTPQGGILDLDTAWKTLLRHALGLEADRPGLLDVLRWAQRESSHSKLTHLSEPDLTRIADQLVATAGQAARHLTRLVRRGRSADTVPLGLVCGVLWGDAGEDTDAAMAQGRFLESLGAEELAPQAAQEWAQATQRLVEEARAAHEDATVATWIRRAEDQLGRLRARELAAVSDVLPAGFDQRLEVTGWRLEALLDDPTEDKLARLTEGVQQVRRHLEATRPDQRRRTRALEMALRLGRRLVRTAAHDRPDDLPQTAALYRSEGAYVDEARDALSVGETVTALADAYGKLTGQLDAERADRDRHFAARLGQWAETEPLGQIVLPIEDVLDRVITPLATQAPVLLLVVDGLSWDTAHRLLDHVTARGWAPHAPQAGAWPVVLAAFPTVTRISRACLLTGTRTTGGQPVEVEGFTAHAGLREAAGGQPPVLFHKSDLRVETGRIAPAVREPVTDPDQRVVGVVVNAVDDHLDKGGQLTLAEGLEGITPLRWLLSDAAEAGRVVVLTSDHGHIHEHGTQVIQPNSGGGERWRPSGGAPTGQEEVALTGPRVLACDGQVIAAATERIRYQTTRKNGYHGGATPAEVLCPLAVFAPADVSLDGFVQVDAQLRPDWWWETRPVRQAEPGVMDRRVVEDAKGVPQLFAPKETPQDREQPAWITRILDSPLLDQQRQIVGRAALDDDDLAGLLALLTAHGDVITRPALTRATGLPAARLQGKLQALRGMLNVDMYPVVEIEGDGTIRLNRNLLNTQFGLSSP